MCGVKLTHHKRSEKVSKMPVYKLYYFDIRARAEPTRLCFAAAGVKYEDIRISFQEWPKLKQVLAMNASIKPRIAPQEAQALFLWLMYHEGLSPMGYLPVLEVDGKKLCESLAILRYVARECGLSPADSFEVAQCDWIVDASNAMLEKRVTIFLEKDAEKKKCLQEAFDNTQLPSFMDKLTALLKSNNGGTEFIVGNKLTYADLATFNQCDLCASVLDKYPELKAHYQRIGEIPAIKEYIKTRPANKA